MVPEGWIYTALSKVMEFKNGLNFTKSDQGEEIKIVGVSNFKDYSELRSTEHLAVVRVAQSIRDGELLKDGDLLFVRSNGNKDLIGRCLFFPEVRERIAYSGFTIRGRVNDTNLLPEYLSNVARSPIMKQQISRNGGGTNISNLSQQILGDISVALPPLLEQRRITQILSTWDQAITATERLLENSQQRKKGLMQQLLTGKKRLPGFEGEWRTVELGSLGSTYSGLSGKTKEDFGVGEPFVTYMGVFSDGAIKTDRFDYVRLSEGESQHKVQYGDILFTTSSETPEEVGMASVLLEDLPYDLYLNSFCFGFRPNSLEELVPEYAKFLFRGEEMRRRISALAQGATRYNLSKKQLVKLDVLLPGKAEQAAISQILTTSDMEISAVKHRLVYLREEKKALMQQLLTGKRRVQVDTEAA